MDETIFKEVLQDKKQFFEYPTLKQMDLSKVTLEKVYNWSKSKVVYGKLASYIPELEKVAPNKFAISIGDLHDSILSVGNGQNVRVSIQSVIKPFLYLYALEKGVAPESISAIEATALHFDTDPVLLPETQRAKPGHPLNNAGAISSAGCIDVFANFLSFMRELTGNSKLNSLENVFESEMKTNSNNRAIAYRLVASGRFKNMQEGEKALENYTRACSIGVTTEEVVKACLILANGGVKNYQQLLNKDHIVRTLNVMNTYGLYEHTGEISLLAAGVRALSCKSGVGGLIVNIDPGRGAFATYGAKLDAAGNSVFGKYALIPLNHLLASPTSFRLSSNEIIKSLEQSMKNEI